MRIRKQVKQALSLILGTLITVFAFSLLLVTIADLNTDSTSQFVSGAHVHEYSQEQPQLTENIPQAPTASGQEHAHQEPPVEQPAAPPPVIEDNPVALETNPKITINIKPVLIIIGGIVLAVAIIVGIVLLIRKLARSRLYRYEIEEDAPVAEELAESAEWESDISARLSHAASADEEPGQGIGEEDKIVYKEGRGYCFSPVLASTNLTASTDDASASAGAVEELKPGIRAEVSSNPPSSFEYDDTGESDIDYVDIPRLFSM